MADAQAGAVLSWGAGDTGQLGDGTTEDRHAPGPVTSLLRADVDQLVAGGVSSGSAFVLARTCSTVKAWGDNVTGQLGNGGTEDQLVPGSVPGLANIKDIAAGGSHALALDSSGQVYSWGDNAYGQLGNNRTGDMRTAPDRVQGMPKVKQIAAGFDFSLALLENGKVYAWGRGVHGQIGIGSRATSSVPRQVTGLENIVAISAGGHHALALTADGTVKSWGYNLYGQLGNSSTKSSTVPVDVDWLEGVQTIVAGTHHHYAVTANGNVWGWGSNQDGQLLEGDETFGDNASRTNRTAPVEIPRLKGAKVLTAGAQHGLAIIGDSVHAWGNNAEGQLGNGTATSGFDAVKLPGSGYKAVIASLGGNTTYVY
ncbi:RCC1 domain-containing protein [Streptomyces sp. NPDC102283]|uniref:RCC1 domain-containing protein n=1 Tax=Streptomyces sp. NPDC102283 TaxID=3366155 RepID=UPI0038074965